MPIWSVVKLSSRAIVFSVVLFSPINSSALAELPKRPGKDDSGCTQSIEVVLDTAGKGHRSSRHANYRPV